MDCDSGDSHGGRGFWHVVEQGNAHRVREVGGVLLGSSKADSIRDSRAFVTERTDEDVCFFVLENAEVRPNGRVEATEDTAEHILSLIHI